MSTGFTTERIQGALTAFRRFLSSESGGTLLSGYSSTAYRQEPDFELMIEGACAAIQADGASGEPYILPTVWPDFGTVSTAALWGGKIIPACGEQRVHIHPVARVLKDLENLVCRQSFEESDFQKAVNLYQRVCERLETDEIFARTPDFQGPMNTLALLIDQTELICGLYTEPELIASVLDRVTDTLIEYFQRFREIIGPSKVIGNIWPYIVLPDGQGVGITQDYMPLLGPDLYAQFEIPRLKRIADEFGGVFIHCCGAYRQHLQTLQQANFKIWGIEVHYPCTDIAEVFNALGRKLVYVPYVAPTGAQQYPSLIEFCDYLAEQKCSGSKYWFCVSDGNDLSALRRAIREINGGECDCYNINL